MFGEQFGVLNGSSSLGAHAFLDGGLVQMEPIFEVLGVGSFDVRFEFGAEEEVVVREA